MYIDGLGINNFRGIAEYVEFTGLSKFNFFIGKNNSGKSTVLFALESINKFQHKIYGDDKSFIDKKQFNDPNKEITFVVKYLIDQISTLSRNFQFKKTSKEYKDGILDFLKFLAGIDGYISINFSLYSDERRIFVKGVPALEFLTRATKDFADVSILSGLNFRRIGVQVLNSSSLDINLIMMGLLREAESCLRVNIPTTHLIPAKRSIEYNTTGNFNFAGQGLTKKLASLERPNIENLSDKQKFFNIRDFFRRVVEDSSAEIEIPFTQDCIIVTLFGKTLELTQLGTGIEELINICTSCSLVDKSIICIEEPETHLHPKMQQKLIDYLSKYTNNQYFISTHSASLIDANIDLSQKSIYHVLLYNNATRIENALERREQFNAVFDMGYRSSDLLQANYIIWVEGPSDRIYINHFISLVDPNLREGVEYVILFYGGKLLSHISGSEDLGEFIQVMTVNRQCCIVMDSDKDKKSKKLNQTKVRIQTEFEKSHSFVWITDGREIENYIEYDIISEFVAQKYKSTLLNDNIDMFTDVTKIKNKRRSELNKVELARFVSEKKRSIDNILLKKKMQELIERIKLANGIN